MAGSNFEIDSDGNLVVDDGGLSIDWASVAEVRKDDAPSGQNDDSFGQGTKEDTGVPTIVDGSIPPNKSDLKTFGVFEETAQTGGGFMHLFWTREQDPRGTTNMDFEFNQSEVISANGVTPDRTAGDLLIVYELSKGGTVPELFLFTWLDGSEGIACEASNSYPCWGDREGLSGAGNATGSINTSAIAGVDSDGLGDLDPRTFGEASVSLDAIFDPTVCMSFGSAYLKSRSSDSFPAALKDFIAPEPVDISNCGNITIRKQTDPDGDGTSFGYTTSGGLTPAAFSLSDDGVQDYGSVVLAGDYTVSETVPNGWNLTDISCSTSGGATANANLGTGTIDITITPDGAVDCTYTNVARGEIVIAKVTDPAGDPAIFAFTGDVSGNLSHGGSASALVAPGVYTSTETVPGGWNLTGISCDDGDSFSSGNTANFVVGAGETVTCTFTNVKQGTIIVEKQTNPDGDPANFNFTGSAAGTISDNGQIVVGNLAPNQYLSTETVPAGWDLTGISCDDANSFGSVGTGTATFNLEPGETVKCTFTNTKRGNIVIAKVTDPANDPASFVFTGDVSGSLSDGGSASAEVVPGNYSSSETVPIGWNLTGISCDDGDSSGTGNTANFVVGAGETVTCTFTNVKQGSIIVEKQTIPAGASGNFTFSGDAAGAIPDNGQIVVNNLVPGQYQSTEEALAGWDLTGISCDDANSSGDTGSATATFNVEPGETVKCTFTNSTGAILITKTAKNASLGSGLHPLAGVQFSINSGNGTVNATTDANGEACVSGLIPGVSHTVTELVPVGYALADGTLNPQSVVVSAGADCTVGTPDQVDFVNDPLSEITIGFTSLAGDGVTVVTSVICVSLNPVYDSGDLGSLNDGESFTLTNLKEGIYECTIVVDP